MPSDDLSRRFTALEGELARAKLERAELSALRERLAAMENRIPAEDVPEVSLLRQQVTALRAEKLELEDRLRVVAAPRLDTTPLQLSEGFRAAAQALREGLAPRPGDRSGFALADFQVGVKTLLAIGPDGALRFVLPAPGEKPDAQSLSELRFTLRAAEVTAEVSGLIPVPMLLGLPREAAMTALARAGIKPGPVTERESEYAVGQVIGQQPEPGVEVPADIPVALVLAAAITALVPEVIGATLEDATQRLQAAGFAPGEVKGSGLVVAQVPLAGQRLARGAAVALTLRPRLRNTPMLVGLTLEEAQSALKAAELEPGALSEAPGGTAGLVMAQDPPAGMELEPGGKVALTLGTGPGVEALIERTVKAAAESRSGISGRLLRQRLEAAGLKDAAAFAALAAASDPDLQRVIGAPTPRGLADARAALKKALG
ncbi:MAG: PASTA domain-containing protein [Roseococcus sp.]